MGAMAISANGHFLVIVLKQLLAMFAGLVPRQLIGRQAVGVHPPHIAMAARAQLGDCLFVIGPLEIIRGVSGFVGRLRIAAVATHAGQTGLGMHARRPQLDLILVAIQAAGTIGGGRGGGQDS